MPPKKKRGKVSKLARMSEEEKLRYLQHRAEIELEAQRRKQQLISAFTKNKLKREETFARLNLAKINEQWRFHLRQLKYKELYDNSEYLWKHFDTALKAKNAVIDQLYEKLRIADVDHRKLQASHIKMIDQFIKEHRLRLNKFHQFYLGSLAKIKNKELVVMNSSKDILNESCGQIEVITYAQNISIDNKLMETMVRNAINTNTIEYSKMEDKKYIEGEIGSKTDELWMRLNKVITNYQSETNDKRKQYGILVEQDLAHQQESSQFPILQSHLFHTIESLKYHENSLILTADRIVTELSDQVEVLNEQIRKLRQDLNMNRMKSEEELKKQTIVSSNVIQYLKKIKKKGISLMIRMKMCSNFENLLIAIKKYNVYCIDKLEDENFDRVIKPFDKLKNFWRQYNSIQTENIFIKIDYDQLKNENKELRDLLRSYLVAIAWIPNTKSTNFV